MRVPAPPLTRPGWCGVGRLRVSGPPPPSSSIRHHHPLRCHAASALQTLQSSSVVEARPPGPPRESLRRRGPRRAVPRGCIRATRPRPCHTHMASASPAARRYGNASGNAEGPWYGTASRSSPAAARGNGPAATSSPVHSTILAATCGAGVQGKRHGRHGTKTTHQAQDTRAQSDTIAQPDHWATPIVVTRSRHRALRTWVPSGMPPHGQPSTALTKFWSWQRGCTASLHDVGRVPARGSALGLLGSPRSAGAVVSDARGMCTRTAAVGSRHWLMWADQRRDAVHEGLASVLIKLAASIVLSAPFASAKTPTRTSWGLTVLPPWAELSQDQVCMPCSPSSCQPGPEPSLPHEAPTSTFSRNATTGKRGTRHRPLLVGPHVFGPPKGRVQETYQIERVHLPQRSPRSGCSSRDGWPHLASSLVAYCCLPAPPSSGAGTPRVAVKAPRD